MQCPSFCQANSFYKFVCISKRQICVSEIKCDCTILEQDPSFTLCPWTRMAAQAQIIWGFVLQYLKNTRLPKSFTSYKHSLIHQHKVKVILSASLLLQIKEAALLKLGQLICPFGKAYHRGVTVEGP